MGKTRDFWEKKTDRYLGRRPSLAKAGDPKFDSFEVPFVCLLVHKSQCLQINIYIYIYIYIYILYYINIYISITPFQLACAKVPSGALHTGKWKLARSEGINGLLF